MAGKSRPRRRPGATATLKGSVIVGFEAGKGGIEHFSARHDNDVVTSGDLVSPENLARQALGAVPLDGAAQLARGGDAEPRPGTPVLEQKHRHEPAGDPRSLAVDALELGPAADPLGGCQA